MPAPEKVPISAPHLPNPVNSGLAATNWRRHECVFAVRRPSRSLRGMRRNGGFSTERSSHNAPCYAGYSRTIGTLSQLKRVVQMSADGDEKSYRSLAFSTVFHHQGPGGSCVCPNVDTVIHSRKCSHNRHQPTKCVKCVKLSETRRLDPHRSRAHSAGARRLVNQQGAQL